MFFETCVNRGRHSFFEKVSGTKSRGAGFGADFAVWVAIDRTGDFRIARILEGNQHRIQRFAIANANIALTNQPVRSDALSDKTGIPDIPQDADSAAVDPLCRVTEHAR